MHPARLWKSLEEDRKVQCRLCSHYCRIEPGEYGKCGVRTNQDGALFTLTYDRVAALNLDPIEKKPLFHFLPGTQSFSVGTMGCNLACTFCQNYTLSQAPKQSGRVSGERVSPEQLANAAKHYKAESISYTYSEPTIFFELVRDTAQHAREQGLRNALVTNGFMTRECLEELGPLVDAANTDLKAFSEEFYEQCSGAKLKPVLNNLRSMKELGWWVEVTTLIIPGLNDSDEELQNLVSFIASDLGADTPWHISRFHPTYRMTDRPSTPVETLERAWNIGARKGLRYVYLGNVPGHQTESTICPGCGETVLDRRGFTLRRRNLRNGRCASCGRTIDGVGLG
jgi:pyruvate formate lyase activating enzyme